MSTFVTADALDGLAHLFETMPDTSRRAARLAINQVANRSAIRDISNEIYSQVMFPQGYLSLPDRLGVTKNATDADLEAIIRARQRATSLARFLVPGQTQATARTSGVAVQVKPGNVKYFKNGFLVKLRAGSSTETQNNLGLAVRLPAGERPKFGKGQMLEERVGKDGQPKSAVWLLYGPSVDQVFRGVADDLSGHIADDVTSEFMRQFTRLNEV